MIAHGLSATEALVAATAGSAYALGLDGHVGSVAVGKRADLLVLDGDPLERPELLGRREHVWLVIQHGSPVAGAALERDLDPTLPVATG
jgi:imidazolonepropionase-like amidohydrolase